MRAREWTTPLTITLMLLFLCLPVQAQEAGAKPADMQSGGLLMRRAGGYTTATLLNTDVSIVVNGLVARVSVMQEFENDGQEWVEGIYVFPLPDEAAVDHMRMYIGERFIEGEIREKEQARKEYEQAKSAGKKTSLVEQQRANLFTTSVANIGPGEKVIIEIEYLQNLRYEEGIFSLRYPMTLTPRYIPGTATGDRQGSGWSADTNLVDDASLITPPMIASSNSHRVSLRATVNAGMPLEIIASRYHPVNVSEVNGSYSVALAGGQASMDHDFELIWRPIPAATPRALAFSETIEGQPHYLLMVVPPEPDLVEGATMPREMIFIIDTSGSMHGVSMEQARNALARALETLRPGDYFNVVEFNSQTNPLFPASVIAGNGNLVTARNFVQNLRSNGGTEMYSALSFALRTPTTENLLRQIVFITDGAVGNEDGLFELIDKKLNGARLFTVGIGSAPNSWFMRKAAETGRGSFTIISALHEVGEKMDRLFRKLESPQVTDIEVQWPSGVVVDGYPGVVPDLYLGEPVVVKARASGKAQPGDVVRIAGNSVGGSWSEELTLVGREQSAGVGALWARARIGELLDQMRRGRSEDDVRGDVVETALAHHLVSKYTSLVAVDKTPVRPAGSGLDSEQVANLMPHGQSGSILTGFPATATNASQLLQSGIALLLLALLVLVWPRANRRISYEPIH